MLHHSKALHCCHSDVGLISRTSRPDRSLPVLQSIYALQEQLLAPEKA